MSLERSGLYTFFSFAGIAIVTVPQAGGRIVVFPVIGAVSSVVLLRPEWSPKVSEAAAAIQ